MSDDGSIFHRLHLYDYSRHVLHTKESETVVKGSKVKFDPNAIEKTTNTNNIEYIHGHNKSRDDAYILKLVSDLLLRGYSYAGLPKEPSDMQALLFRCLMTQRTVRKYRNALKNNEDALARQVLNPGVLALCILHAKMRMMEKLIQQLILAGMRKNSTGTFSMTIVQE